jgi:hypothetical protein
MDIKLRPCKIKTIRTKPSILSKKPTVVNPVNITRKKQPMI